MVTQTGPNADADAVGSKPYPGGKGGAGVYHQLIRLMPPHSTYVEPFLGKGAVMLNKRPAAASVGIDADAGVVTWWQRQQRRCPRRDLTIRRGDALQILASLLTRVDRQWLFYVDPPYLRSVRTRLIYRREFATPELHTTLLTLLQQLADRGAMVMVSGYSAPLYLTRLERWHLHTFPAMTRGGLREEHVWCSFPPPAVLHDCRYAGNNYRERLRIKRKAARWRRKLAAMHPLERQVIAEALADVSSDIVIADAGGLRCS